MEYHDFANPDVRRQYRGTWDAVQEQHLPLPVVAIDGEFVSIGRVDYQDIVVAVDERLREQSKATT